MACFIAPTAEAIITAVASKKIKSNEANNTTGKIPFSRKLKWLSNMLWGGSALLAFEHVWHGEVIPVFPFLSAMSNAADTQVMLHEIATTGITMTALVTAAWAGMLAVVHCIEKSSDSVTLAR